MFEARFSKLFYHIYKIGLPRLHVQMVLFRVSAINVYKIDLTFTGT